jgi:DNA polymerase I
VTVAILLLDGYSLFFRAFYALPEMSTSAGQPTNALYGFSALLLKLLREERPAAVALARDLPGKTFRHEQYDGYKAGRPRLAAALVSQLAHFDGLVEAFGFPSFSAPGFEADDVLATLATRHGARGERVMIVSGDRDLLQLVDDTTEVLFVGQRGKAPVRYDQTGVYARFGILPERLPAYVALIGDGSDNIPKVKGIGAAKARALMSRFETISELMEGLDTVDPRLLLSSHEAQIRQSEWLARLRRDVPLPDLEPARFTSAARERTRELFEAWEFKSLLPRLVALGPEA